MRLQVYLSHNGVCSRREAMDLVKSGRVSVNGKVVSEPSHDVDGQKDKIVFDGGRVYLKKFAYVMMNKPKGYVTTKVAQKDQISVLALLPKKFYHLAPVGRLDKDTEGLLLLTNDGDLAHQLTHPKFHLDKTYFLTCRGELTPLDKKKLESGVYLDGKKTSSCHITNTRLIKGQIVLRITIHEGRKRQIRRMFAKVNAKVTYLKREIQGPLKLGSLKKGEWRLLNKKEIQELHDYH